MVFEPIQHVRTVTSMPTSLTPSEPVTKRAVTGGSRLTFHPKVRHTAIES